ncbi:MAG: glycoside hydrolase family 3 C-terminal domain-containing protein, partial [Planctomycetes bacterium]|nr:glycoside hydrolase family 3 C-terminal domain-containing protein [Planctomycetota bacterium]
MDTNVHMNAYNNAVLNLEERVSALLRVMTDGEKLQMLTGKDMWSWRGIERLGIPEMRVTDGPHGVTCGSGDPAMSYPTAVGMASTWNPELIQEMAVELGKEMHAKGYHILLGPAIDIHRAPKFGRNYEAYSEDPVLGGKMGAAWIRGVQSQGIGTTPKHLAGYSTTGFMDDVQVDEQALREIYLKPFEIVVKEAFPTGMMSSYNQVNGHPTSQHPMQRDIVKAEWGFDGFMISDWRGALDIACVANGMDIEMPGPGKIATPENLETEISAERISMQRIDDAVSRILRAIIRSGRMDAQPPQIIAEHNTPQQHDIARRVAEESMVLLKNDKQTLPLQVDALSSVALIGPNAATARLGGGGSAAVSPFYTVSPLEGLQKVLPDNVTLHYEEGCAFKGNMPLVDMAALNNLQVQYFEPNDCSGPVAATAEAAQIDYAWGWVSPEDGVPKNDWSALWQGELIAEDAGEYELALSYQDGGVQLWIDDELCIDQWAPPEGDDFEAGYKDLSESCRKVFTAGQRMQIRIQYRKYANRANLRFEWRKPANETALEAAVRVAKASDVAVLCVGLSNLFEGGGMRRADMELPAGQNELIRAVQAVNKNTIVVLIGGSPVIMEQWIDDVPAVVMAWYPGVEGGNALANILTGAVNPSGKLPTSIARRYEDCAAYGSEDAVDGKVHYTEGVFVGYRHFDKHKIAPRFPFAHGLSYTTFSSADV